MQSTPDDYVRHSWNAAGRLQLSARLEPESGAVRTSTLDGDERAAIVVHVDESRLATDEESTETNETSVETGSTPRSRERARAIGRIVEGPGLPRPVIERLLCSGRIRTAVTARDTAGQFTVLDLGRSHRVVTE
jgi:hypothetical protein